MFGLRSARGRAILAGTVLVLLVVGMGALAAWRARDDEQLHSTLDHASSATTSLESAQAEFWRAQAALSALVISGDPALVDDYDSAFAAAEQNLAKARAQFMAVGEADKASALDGLTNRFGQFNESVRPLFPTLIEADRQMLIELASATMSGLAATSTAIIADLKDMVQEAQQEASVKREAAEGAAEVTLLLLLGLSGVALATGVGTVVTLVGSVVGPLAALQASARAITSGRPQARAKVAGPEEVASLARDFNEMTDALSVKTQALQESARQYRLLAENASDHVWTMDLGLRYTYVSPSVTRMRGYTVEEVMRGGVAQTLTPASLEIARKALAEELAKERMEPKDPFRSRSLEIEMYCKDGSTIWTEVKITFLRDPDGQPVGILGVTRDITERKRAEEALRESEENYRELVENINEIIYTVDSNGVITYISPVVEQLGGYTPSEVIGRPFTEFVHPDDISPLMRSFQETFAGNLEAFEYRVLTKSGEARWVRTSSRPVLEGDRVVSFHAVLTDITERKKAEEALRESEARYKALFAGAPEGMLVADLQTRQFRYANPAMCSMFGYTEEEFLRMGVADIHPKESLDHVLAEFEAQARGEKVFSPGLPCLRKDGTLLYANISAVTTVLDGRKCNVGIFSDVTEQKRAEEKLRESEERTRLIVETAHDAFISVDTSGAITAWNAQAEKTFGWAEAEAIGRNIAETIIPPRHRQAHTRGLNHFLATGEGPVLDKSVEITALHRDGHEFPAELAVWVVSSGETSTFNAFVRDISERKRAEETLRESESKYRTLVESLPQKVFFKDRNSVYVSCNENYARDLLINPDEIAGKTDSDFYPKELAEKYRADDMRIVESGETEDIEEAYVQDGRQAYVHTIKTPVRDEKDSVVGVLGIFWDITERKRAEQGLAESRQMLENVTQGITEGILLLSKDLEILWANDAIPEQTGYEMAQILGSPCYKVTHHRETPCGGRLDPCPIREVLQTGKPVTVTHIHLSAAGEELPIEVTVYPIRDEKGEIVQFVHMSRDVSERKKAEEERERLHAELEVRAITDGLTGFYNHAHFFQRLAEETERSKRYNHGFAVLMMDVDNFKKFNDSHGHQAGDEMLRLVADSIRSGLRRSDLAFRYGGDEFAAILLHADAARARAVIDRINRRLSMSLKQMNDGAAARVSLSAGAACFPEEGSTADELVSVADAALYSAKWAARARSVMEEGYAIESLTPPPATSGEAQTGTLANTVGSLAAALRELGVPNALAELNLRTVAALGKLALIKDPYIRGHQERTSEVAATVAEEMGLSSDRVRGTRLAGLLHDLGKAGISKRILNKPGKLTEEEFAEIKEHPPLGSMMIISEIEALQQVVPIVRHHHEHFDGRGYPDGLAGQDIPLEARILGVVDAFDAMTHERSYRKAMSREKALAELERGAGTQFDPAVVEAFLAWASREGAEPEARKQPASEDKQLAPVRTTKT